MVYWLGTLNAQGVRGLVGFKHLSVIKLGGEGVCVCLPLSFNLSYSVWLEYRRSIEGRIMDAA